MTTENVASKPTKPAASPRPVPRADAHPFGVTAADPYGLADEDLALVSLGRGTSSSSDAADDSNGEYAAASQISFGKKQSLPANYKAQVSAAISGKTLTVGAAQPVAAESITINTTKGARATVAINGHKHIGGTGTNHNDNARTIALPSFNGFGASAFGLTLGVPAASLQSGTYAIAIGHLDDDDSDGNFLCGTCHGEKHTASFEAVDETAWTIPDGWVEEGGQPDAESDQANSAHGRRKLTIVKYVAKTTPTP